MKDLRRYAVLSIVGVLASFCSAWACNQGYQTQCITGYLGKPTCHCVFVGPVVNSFHVNGIPVTILYDMPGKQSSSTYSSGSITGSTFTQQLTQTDGNSVTGAFSFLGSGGNGGEGWSTGQVSGSAISVTKTTTNPIGLTRNGTIDGIDPENDTIYIWVNNLSTLSTPYIGSIPGQATITYSTNDGLPNTVLGFTVRQLKGIDGIPVPLQKSFRTFTAQDKTAFIALDPLAGLWPADAPYPALAANRFLYMGRITMVGPASASADIPNNGGTIQWGMQNTSTSGMVNTSTNTITATGGFSINVLVGTVNFGVSLQSTTTTSYLESTTALSGTQLQATYSLKSSTVCLGIVADLYVDAQFSSYLVLPITLSTDCADTSYQLLLGSSGEPIENEAVVLATSGGPSMMVYTDANGYYPVVK